jgi:two-component system cell cycle response regulator DivK
MSKTVLIVEDDSFNLMFMRELLVSLGLHTLEAGSADEAVAAALADRPDLILMDIQLRGSSGLQATRRLRQQEPLAGVPIIAVTALALDDDRRRALEAGCDDHVAKPIDVATFIATVSRVLGLPAP